jgi:fatty acid desaturase
MDAPCGDVPMKISPDAPQPAPTHKSVPRMRRQLFIKAFGPSLTHISTIIMTGTLFALLLRMPFWFAFVPSVILAHRIGIMMHEYVHGIPFKRYRHNLEVLAFFDGLMLMFGFLELVRGTHLSHHRWLNREGDSAFRTSAESRPKKGVIGLFQSMEISQYFNFYFEAILGKHPYVRGPLLAVGGLTSVLWVLFWVQIGRSDMIWRILTVTVFTTAVPVSLRGAIEHHSEPSAEGFANEYEVMIPMFNVNRHVHHHEAPSLPWYMLEFRTRTPLSKSSYYTHWFKANITRELVLMRPERSDQKASKLNSN